MVEFLFENNFFKEPNSSVNQKVSGVTNGTKCAQETASLVWFRYIDDIFSIFGSKNIFRKT